MTLGLLKSNQENQFAFIYVFYKAVKRFSPSKGY